MMFTDLEHTDPIIVIEETDEQIPGLMQMPQKIAVRLPELEEMEEDEIFEVDKPAVEELTPEIADQMFWNLVAKFNWRNASDERMGNIKTVNIFNAFSNFQKKIFRDKYRERYNALYLVLKDSISDRALTPEPIISHFIAMGEHTYNSVCENPLLAGFFIDEKECQNFAPGL